MIRQFQILAFLLCSMLSFGQNDSAFFFNEFNVSVNHITFNKNSTAYFGFEIGANHIFFPDKQVNIVTGIEYNMTVQYLLSMRGGHSSNFSDITFYINSLSIPVTARLNFGHKTKFFIESGVYLDINLIAKMRGKMHTYLPDSTMTTKDSDINERTDISSLNYGVSAGLGVSFPISKIRLFIKPEYKFGFAKLYSGNDDITNSYIRLVIGAKIF